MMMTVMIGIVGLIMLAMYDPKPVEAMSDYRKVVSA